MIDWLLENKDWFFSGAGLSLLTIAFALLKRSLRDIDSDQPTQLPEIFHPKMGGRLAVWLIIFGLIVVFFYVAAGQSLRNQ